MYDIVVWVDGTVQLVNAKTTRRVVEKMITGGKSIMLFHHKARKGDLSIEVANSQYLDKYSSIFWNNQVQPYQNITAQYKSYLKEGMVNHTHRIYTVSNEVCMSRLLWSYSYFF